VSRQYHVYLKTSARGRPSQYTLTQLSTAGTAKHTATIVANIPMKRILHNGYSQSTPPTTTNQLVKRTRSQRQPRIARDTQMLPLARKAEWTHRTQQLTATLGAHFGQLSRNLEARITQQPRRFTSELSVPRKKSVPCHGAIHINPTRTNPRPSCVSEQTSDI